MIESYTKIANLVLERTKRKPNPWAICTAQVGRKDPAKYERCVMKVKKSAGLTEARKGVMPKMKMGVHKDPKGGLTQKGVAAYRAANPGI